LPSAFYFISSHKSQQSELFFYFSFQFFTQHKKAREFRETHN
jgi:hypothetical protein